MSSRNIDRTKQKFDIESDVSDDEVPEAPSNQKQGSSSKQTYQSIQDTLYQQNMQKYIKYLGEFAKGAEQAQAKIFNDGASYVNHSLIDVTQIKNIGLFDIINVEEERNKNNFVKTLTVFTYLDNQVNKVVDLLQMDLYGTLLMYGEQSPTKQTAEDPETMTARIFPTYRKMFDLVKKLMSYIENLVIQLHSMINRKQPNYKIFKGINFDFVVHILGRALRSIYVIDAIVMNNPNIEQHFQAYKRMIQLARKQPQKFGSTTYKLKKIQKMMKKMQDTILSRNCMAVVMQTNFDQAIEINKIGVGNIKNNKDLRQYLELYLMRTFDSIQKNLGEVNNVMDEQKRLLDLMCVYSLYRKLYPSEDYRDFWKRLWTFQKKIPIVEAYSFVCVYISVFMQQLCQVSKKPSSLDPNPKDEALFLDGYIRKLNEKVGVDFVSNYRKFCVWLSRMQSILTSNSSLKDLKQNKLKMLQERLSNRIHMICQGINIIYQTNKLIYLCFMLHINQRKPVSTNLLGYLILGLQCLKATAYMINKKSQAFDTTILSKTIARDIHILLDPYYQNVKRQCESSSKNKQLMQKRDALNMLMNILKTPMSELKITIIKYCLHFIDNKQIIKEEQLTQIYNLLNKMQILAYHHILVQRYQRCEYLYSCKDILPAVFEWKRQNPNTCKRLQFLFDSFEDSAEMLKKCEHLSNKNQIFEDYRKFIISSFEENYMLPLKRKVQDFLRLNTHCMLIQKLDGLNPYKQEMSDLIKLIQFQKISIFDTKIDLKIEISKSFNETFYNMNTMNTYDMQTYEQMKIMANYLFGFNLHDFYLPNQSVSQGKFDIFTIIRNIPKFVSTYNYNLLSQKFLQVTNQQKMISSVGIQQISDSIKTHGLGILSTTVNAFYKFQKQQIQYFNQFMFNDMIRSLLQRQKKWFKNELQKQRQADGNQSHYPYEKARALYKQIKNLQKYQDDSNMLDHLRVIITSIGNGLGFVRLLRSASLNYSSKSVQFLPIKIELDESLQEICAKANLSETSKSTCAELDKILGKLQDNFSGKIDYLNLMVKMFQKLSSKQNKHLNNFFFIIPALSINYIEHMGKGKQKIARKMSTKSFIYDDGFVLGIAYLLCLLKQNPHYKTLHWDLATSLYIENAKNYSKEVTNENASRSAKLKQDINTQNLMVLKKLELMEQQFKFFHYNIVSSNVLFTASEIESNNNNNPASPPTASS